MRIAIEHTTRRLSLFGLRSSLDVGDAENLPFPGGQFYLVYSWGVLHHTPDTPRARRRERAAIARFCDSSVILAVSPPAFPV